MKDGKSPNPNDIHPIAGYDKEVYVKPTITNPNIIVGDFTYIADSEFESHVTNFYPWSKDKLIIKFICLAMTDAYIDAHFHEIKKYGSVIESRLDDTDCKIDSLKKDNRIYIEGYARSGEQVTLIDTDYNPTIQTLFHG